jgi:SEC-C motif
MAKIGRNDPCACGSGKKYKKCCMASDEAAARAVQPAAVPVRRPSLANYFQEHDEPDELTEASNAVVDMVQAGNLDAAEQAAHDLLARFPDVHDGYDRLGMVYEARGDHRQAADCYRKARCGSAFRIPVAGDFRSGQARMGCGHQWSTRCGSCLASTDSSGPKAQSGTAHTKDRRLRREVHRNC